MLRNGPLVTEFKCDDSFQIYDSGILSQNDIPLDDPNTDLNHTNLHQQGLEQITKTAEAGDSDTLIIPAHGDV